MEVDLEVADPESLKTPVLLLVFDRPETTRAVVDTIRAARPSEYFVAADGPRPDRQDDAEKCRAAREIATAVDWPCNVHTLFRDSNLGSGPAVASAITWFFEEVPQGIILEDDCVPSRSFYRFCDELLSYYQENPVVMHISGDNFQYGKKRGNGSYYFSRYTHTWGWATWRRAWKQYDFELAPESERSHVWDGQWLISVEKSHGMAVLPNLNLVTNIGFGENATHTHTLERFAMLPAQEMPFPLKHPDRIEIDRAADIRTYYANFRNVPDLRLIPWYFLVDYVTFRAARLNNLIRKGFTRAWTGLARRTGTRE